jgi:hypothetical protein
VDTVRRRRLLSAPGILHLAQGPHEGPLFYLWPLNGGKRGPEERARRPRWRRTAGRVTRAFKRERAFLILAQSHPSFCWSSIVERRVSSALAAAVKLFLPRFAEDAELTLLPVRRLR